MHSICHIIEAHATWKKIQNLRNHDLVTLNGESLDIASVVSVARYGCRPILDSQKGTVDRITACADFLDSYLGKGYNVYGARASMTFANRHLLMVTGANTGFGGSADSRTHDHSRLQSSLLQLTQSGILASRNNINVYQDCGEAMFMPASWTRATMLVRINSLSRGHSAVRLEIIEAVLKLIEHHINPIIPLRGSISASGDLMPLAYVAGTLEGSPDIQVSFGQGPKVTVVSALDALKAIGLSPISLGPKEGLGILNGTAASAAIASLASHDANNLAILSQVIIAMSCEALRGHADNWHPFMAQIRPHLGQIESASNIKAFLKGSKLAVFKSDRFRDGLFQDRYALRTSSQWIGPQLEDLTLATQQITIELNSTTDNPVIDASGEEIISGGNFQAVSITSASEKIRSSMQMLGKVLSCLCTELINPTTNNGLPPNLCVDDPSLSFTMKGVDINVAAYMSELAYLANPVSSHVQSAEMHNQAVNSLAFITTRYTMEAIKLVKMICAAHLYIVCQALDLRVLHLEFLTLIQPIVAQITSEHFASHTPEGGCARKQQLQNFPAMPLLASTWASSSSLDLTQRCKALADVLSSRLTDLLDQNSLAIGLSNLQQWKSAVSTTSLHVFTSLRTSFIADPTTAVHLGAGTAGLYNFIRRGLGVPFHQGAKEHPKPNDENMLDGRQKKMVGSWISIIFDALDDGRIDDVVMALVEHCGLVADRDRFIDNEKVKGKL